LAKCRPQAGPLAKSRLVRDRQRRGRSHRVRPPVGRLSPGRGRPASSPLVSRGRAPRLRGPKGALLTPSNKRG
jgi:hypothetical protein